MLDLTAPATTAITAGNDAADRTSEFGIAAKPWSPDRSEAVAIDLEHLSRYTLGDGALRDEILDLFLGQLPMTMASLRTATLPADRHRAAHTLKGSARAVGAHRLAELAAAAERATAGGRDWDAAVERLETEAEVVTAFVADLVSRPERAPGAAPV